MCRFFLPTLLDLPLHATFRAEIPLETVRKTAGWSSKLQTFNRFYNRPLAPNNTSFTQIIVELVIPSS